MNKKFNFELTKTLLMHLKKKIKFIVDKLPKTIKLYVYFFIKCHYKAKTLNKKTHNLLFNKSFFYEHFKIKKSRMPLPYFVHFEPTTRCNLSCVFCTRGTLSPENLKTDIDLDLVKHLIKSNPNILMIKIQGLGEPLMAKNFPELVSYIHEKGISMETFTNGTTLKKNKNHREILLKYFSDVFISIDSINQENADKLREGSKINDILQGLETLVNERNNSKSKLKIKVNMVLSLLNYKEVKEVIEKMNAIGVDAIGLHEMDNLKTPEDPDWLKNHIEVIQFRERRKDVLATLSEINPNNYNSEIYNLEQQQSSHYKGNCDWGFYRTFITANGHLTPCCKRMEDNQKITINPLNENFSELWNNEDFINFRKSHLHNLRNSLCDYCPN